MWREVEPRIPYSAHRTNFNICGCFLLFSIYCVEHRTSNRKCRLGHFMLFMGELCLHVCVCKQPRYMRCLGRDAESPRRRTHVRERMKNANTLGIYINFKFCLPTQTQEIHIYTCCTYTRTYIYIYICVFLQVLPAQANGKRKTKMNVQIERISCVRAGCVCCYCPCDMHKKWRRGLSVSMHVDYPLTFPQALPWQQTIGFSLSRYIN